MLRLIPVRPSRKTGRMFELLENRVLFAAGDWDPSFGTGGISQIDLGDRRQVVTDVLATSSRVYVATTPAETLDVLITAFDNAGRVETSFGGDGTVQAPVAGQAEMVAQSDGKLLVAARGGVARFNSNGSLDTSFSGDGVVPLEFYFGQGEISLAPGGKIVVAGALDNSGRFSAIRLNSNGSFDNTLDGDGRVTLDFGGSNDSGQFGVEDMTVQPDGKIIFVGAMRNPDLKSNAFWDGAIARINPDGTYDITFDGDGQILWDTATDDGATAVALAPGGDILVGMMEAESFVRPIRFNSNGSLDVNFPWIDWHDLEIRDINVDSSGRVTVSGFAPMQTDDPAPEAFMARYNSNGTPDRSFGSGRYLRPAGEQTDVAPDGKVVSAGTHPNGVIAAERYLASDSNPQVSVYQAEHARDLDGAVIARTHNGYTGTGYVDYLRDSGARLVWHVDAHQAGTHTFRIRYANGGSRARVMKLMVDDGYGARTQDVLFRPTGSWNRWLTTNVSVSLRAYREIAWRMVVTLQTAGQNGPNIDSLTVIRPEYQPPESGFNEAERQTLSGAVVSSAHPGFKGSGFVDFTADSGGSITWAEMSDAPRDYRLMIQYANGASAARPMELKLNGVVIAPRLSFASTGSWSVWQPVFVPVRLQEGVNTLQLTTIGSNGPNIDWMGIVS